VAWGRLGGVALGGVFVGFGRRRRFFVEIEAAGGCVDDELSCWRDVDVELSCWCDVDVDGADQWWGVVDL
jgi:hypothetical protein